MTVDESELKNKIKLEIQGAFEAPHNPSYDFPLESAIDTLFKLLTFDHGNKDLASAGNEILAGLKDFYQTHEVKSLPTRCEPFCKLVFWLIDPTRYDELDEKNKGLSLAPVLKELKLVTNPVLSEEENVEALRDEPRFAEHVMRMYVARNKVHDSPEYSQQQTGEIFASTCVFLAFCVAEHRAELESVLFAMPAIGQLEKLKTRFGKWAVRHVPVAGQKQRLEGFDGVDPLAVEYLWNDDDDIDDMENDEEESEYEFHEARSGRVIDLVDELPQLVLLGDPGSGKTTTLQFLSWTAADRIIRNPSRGVPLPVYLELKHCSAGPGKSLEEMLGRELEKYECSLDDLNDERFRFLLDGLNEVTSDRRKTVSDAIQNLVQDHEGLQFVISSRPGTYQNQFNCPTLLLQKFSDDQIQDFINRFFPNPQGAADFTAVLRTHPRLWEWGRNPLSLKMIVTIGLQSGGKIPDNQGRLMERFLEGLMSREATQHEVQTDPYVKKRLLSSLAFETRSAGKVVFSFDDAVTHVVNEAKAISDPLDATSFLREVIDNNLLVETATGDLGFSHEMYQEFFSASELLKRRQDDEKILGLIESLAGDPFWNEPLVLLSGLVKDRPSFIKQLSAQSPLLAAKALTSGVTPEPGIQDLVIKTAEQWPGEQSKKTDQADGLLALVELGEFDRFISALKQTEMPTRRHREAIAKAVRQGNAEQVIGMLESLEGLSGRKKQIFDWGVAALMTNRFDTADPGLQQRVRSLAEKLRPIRQQSTGHRQGPGPHTRKNLIQVGSLVRAFHLQDNFLTENLVDQLLQQTSLHKRLAIELIEKYDLQDRFPIESLIDQWVKKPTSTKRLAIELIEKYNLRDRFPIGELVDQWVKKSASTKRLAIELIEKYNLQDRFPIEELVYHLLKRESTKNKRLAIRLIEKYNLQDRFPIEKLVDQLLKRESSKHRRLAIRLIEKYNLQDRFLIENLVDQLINSGAAGNENIRVASELIEKHDLQDRFPIEKLVDTLIKNGSAGNNRVASELIEKHDLQDRFPIEKLVDALIKNGSAGNNRLAIELIEKYDLQGKFPSDKQAGKLSSE